MASTLHVQPTPLLSDGAIQSQVTTPRRHVVLRVLDAIAASNRRKANREIARFLQRTGREFNEL
jgi:hypothetical protein